MAFSLDSKVKDILKNPAAAAVLSRTGGITNGKYQKTRE